MKGSNQAVTICGCGAAVCLALSQIPEVTGYLKMGMVIGSAAFGAAFSYLAKGKDVSGGSLDADGKEK